MQNIDLRVKNPALSHFTRNLILENLFHIVVVDVAYDEWYKTTFLTLRAPKNFTWKASKR